MSESGFKKCCLIKTTVCLTSEWYFLSHRHRVTSLCVQVQLCDRRKVTQLSAFDAAWLFDVGVSGPEASRHAGENIQHG